MTTSVATAVEIAAPFASADPTRVHLHTVRVESKRVWATDGHRAILLNIDALSSEIGDYDPKTLQMLSEPRTMPQIDQVIPADPQIAIELSPEVLGDLQELPFLRNQWTQTLVSFYTDRPPRVCFKRDGSKKVEKHLIKLLLCVSSLARSHAFGCDLDYLLEAIEAVRPEKVILRQDSALDPIVLDGANGRALIMPVRL